MNKKKLVFFMVLFFVFIATVSFTYAYFQLIINGNDNTNEIVTSTGNLSLEYVDGNSIFAEGIEPGWIVNKTIRVTNIGSLDAYYKIFWKELTNTIEDEELIISGVCTSYMNFGEESQVLSGICEDIEEQPVSSIANSIQGNIGIEVGLTHVYSLTIQFIEKNSAQNYNQGKQLMGVLNIGDSIGQYTMNGTLLDAGGNPLANTLVSLSDGKRATTNGEGEFVIEDVNEGSYQLTVNDITNGLSLLTGNKVELSETTISSNIENKEINLIVRLGSETLSYEVIEPEEYDINMVALYVDGVKVNSLDNSKYYSLTSYACTNGETVTWNIESRSVTILPINTTTKCTINLSEVSYELVENINYSGAKYIVNIAHTGIYKIELWGASGGGSDYYRGRGGYTKGLINLNENDELIFYVGGNGDYPNNGYNGGGSGANVNSLGYRYGGGSTDVRFETDSLYDRIMVAAGGGGNSQYSNKGNAGGLIGYEAYGNLIEYKATGGTQTGGGIVNNYNSAFIAGTNGSFGQGGNGGGSETGSYGGGGGYWGGAGGSRLGNGSWPGSGGSSFISGHAGCVAIAATGSTGQRTGTGGATCEVRTNDKLCSVHYSTKEFYETLMIDGAGYTWTNIKSSIPGTSLMPNPNGGNYESGEGHIGDGHARITYIGN